MSNRPKTPRDLRGASGADYLGMRLLMFSRVVHLKQWRLRGVLGPFWRLYCNLDDGAVVIAEGRSFRLRARRVYLVPAWMTWDSECRPGVRHIYAHFDLPGMVASTSRAVFPLPLQVYPRRRRGAAAAPLNLADQFEELAALQETARLDPYTICWSKSLVYWGLREAFAQIDPETRRRCLLPGMRTHALNPVLDSIETNLHADLSNDRLAEWVPCSRTQLVRLFRTYLDISPARYITERRLSRAAERLVHGDDSIEQIAEGCGYPNRHYFTRIFAQHFGLPPARYRQMGP